MPQDSNVVSNFLDATKSVSAGGVDCRTQFTGNSTLQGLFKYATCVISEAIIPLVVSLATAMFVWGVVQYVINSDEEAKKEKGKQFMIWGVIGLTVMFSVWGLVRIVGESFGIKYAIPQLQQ